MSKIYLIILCLFILCSCNTANNANTELFSYPYDYQFYGLNNDNCNFKASTVSTLKGVIDNKESAIFMISSPSCLSCLRFVDVLNDIAINKGIYIYNIDPYSDLYPVFNTSDFDLLLEILKDVNINNEKEFVMPIILIINKGKIDDYIIGYDSYQTIDKMTSRVDQAINKSLIIN